MTSDIKTLQDFANEFIGGLTFGEEIGDAEHQEMASLLFTDGDFGLTEEQDRIAEKLGQEFLDYAKELQESGDLSVALTELADIKDVMTYDGNPQDLSAKELGAYLVSNSIANRMSMDGRIDGGNVNEEFSITSSTLNVALGKQVFGDTNPDLTNGETLTPNSTPSLQDGIKDMLGDGRY